MGGIDPNILKLLNLAGVQPDKVDEYTIAAADHMLRSYELMAIAASQLRSHLKAKGML